jgi:hypothetical protein
MLNDISYPIAAAAVRLINETYVYVNANGGHYDILYQIYIASTWQIKTEVT